MSQQQGYYQQGPPTARLLSTRSTTTRLLSTRSTATGLSSAATSLCPTRSTKGGKLLGQLFKMFVLLFLIRIGMR
ncbi:AVB_G0010540.mRNA.1.CDS.1 [Saccharomyces cerevisiae]|nr:CPG_1a_G0010810.mRNA.1.CDS.1 [Saccharomyces cerevisiae]CAI4350944.1 AIE_G0010850.mRNA.1.CDS.1 [Saccharomyces cerevisiae]CAI4351467.1 AVB_G0010540.mRNA.1.CDS.1 [Saccharomyces cerevisiae]CAI6566414.1 AIE_G0010850.mRNA.1.CDS.1 [Saccharomyces cerevisiae]CAI7074603.1 AVB_G0010540.mRNA.1.CDS.1 [Saccharomyces cerevisiae]